LRSASRVALVIWCGAWPRTRTGASPRGPPAVAWLAVRVSTSEVREIEGGVSQAGSSPAPARR
jgi:hypothetical protein